MNINSESKEIEASDKDVFEFLTDFNKFEKLMPEQIINWQSTPESCSFTIKGMADLSMKIQEKIPNSLIIFSSVGKTPFEYKMTWLIESLEDEKSNVQLNLDADVNPMLSMMLKSPLKNFVNILVQKLNELFGK